MVTKIHRIERTEDYASSVNELIPEWIERSEAALRENYPTAEIKIKVLPNECGSSSLYVETDTNNPREIEETERDVRQVLSDSWERCL